MAFAGLSLHAADQALVQHLLDEAFAQVSTELPELNDAQRGALKKRCDAAVACMRQDAAGPTAPAQQEQPGAPLNAGANGEDVAQLYRELQEATAHVQLMRQRVPDAVCAVAAVRLAHQRPDAKLPDAADLPSLPDVMSLSSGATTATPSKAERAGSGAGEGEGLQEELRARLAAAMDQLPGLRVQLEQVAHRLEANVYAVEAGAARATPPKTVERVFRNQVAAGGEEEEGDMIVVGAGAAS